MGELFRASATAPDLHQTVADLCGRWRIVRDQWQDPNRSAPTGFDYDFAKWADETSARCAREAKALPSNLADAKKQEVADALQNWRAKLSNLPDVRQDYAESVQVWAMTLLRPPTLWQRMRSVRFDYVIIDEAARATTAEMLLRRLYCNLTQRGAFPLPACRSANFGTGTQGVVHVGISTKERH